MAKVNAKEELPGFLEYYEKGIYTKSELIYIVVRFFDGGDTALNYSLWEALPLWVKTEILDFMTDLPEDIVCYMFSGDAEATRKMYFDLKAWLLENKLLAQT